MAYDNIRNMNNASQMWDWSPFNDCFGGKIQMGDIDGMVERNGYFLMVETKRPGVKLNTGQSIMFEAFARMPNCTVIVIWGETNKPSQLQYVGDATIHIASIEVVKKHLADWYNKVDKLPKYEPVNTVTKSQVWQWVLEHSTDLAIMSSLAALVSRLRDMIVDKWIEDNKAA